MIIMTFDKANGDMLLTGDPEEARDLPEALESYLCNGWHLIPPEACGALTCAEIITDDASLNDDGTWTVHGFVYAHMAYQMQDPIAVLREGGTVRMVRA